MRVGVGWTDELECESRCVCWSDAEREGLNGQAVTVVRSEAHSKAARATAVCSGSNSAARTRSACVHTHTSGCSIEWSCSRSIGKSAVSWRLRPSVRVQHALKAATLEMLANTLIS